MNARRGAAVGIAIAAMLACRDRPRQAPPPTTSTSSAAANATTPTTSAPPSVDAATATSSSAAPSAVASADPIDATPRAIGPYELPFLDKRNVYFVVPSSRKKPQRLVANLHGMCNPPGYACGLWQNAASKIGFLVCPTGNASCGPAMYDAPTWTESTAKMDDDLERAIAKVSENYPGEISREGSVLTGFSRGAFAAPDIAKMHPGRWPYLVLNEANVALSAATLKKSGVRAVALIAGEIGANVPGNRATVAALGKAGFPARLWIMKGAGHFYSNDIDQIMTDAIAWAIAEGDAAAEAPAERDAADAGARR